MSEAAAPIAAPAPATPKPTPVPAQATAPVAAPVVPGKKYRIGVIPFLNVQPLLWGLKDGHTLVTVPPSRMGQALQEGRVDVAIAPVVAHFLNPELTVVPVAGIVSKGAVQSVRLLHHRPLGRILRIWADSNSQNSVFLSRLILKRWYGVKKPDIVTADMSTFHANQIGPWDACLQIGDAALNAAPFGMTVTDLGTEWTRQTGKPFVYAVWTARNVEIAREVHPMLMAAKNEGLKHFDDIVKAYKGFWVFDQPKLKAYLENNLAFDLGPAEMQGLMEFKNLLKEEGFL